MPLATATRPLAAPVGTALVTALVIALVTALVTALGAALAAATAAGECIGGDEDASIAEQLLQALPVLGLVEGQPLLELCAVACRADRRQVARRKVRWRQRVPALIDSEAATRTAPYCASSTVIDCEPPCIGTAIAA